jgi:hypothetical protein
MSNKYEYLVLTDNYTWGAGDSESAAFKNAHYRKQRDNAVLFLFNNVDDWSISPYGQVSWSPREACVSIWDINKGSGKRVQREDFDKEVTA